jgi:hypothetical protein
LSVEADHDRLTCDELTPLAAKFDGTDGGAVSPDAEVVALTSAE